MGSIATTQDRCSRYEYQGMKMLSKYFLRDLVDCGTLYKTFGPRFRYQVCFSGCCQNFTILGFDLLFIFYVLTDNVAYLLYVLSVKWSAVYSVQCTSVRAVCQFSLVCVVRRPLQFLLCNLTYFICGKSCNM